MTYGAKGVAELLLCFILLKDYSVIKLYSVIELYGSYRCIVYRVEGSMR